MPDPGPSHSAAVAGGDEADFEQAWPELREELAAELQGTSGAGDQDVYRPRF